MNHVTLDQASIPRGNHWLTPYYFSRAAFSIVWVAAAFLFARNMPSPAAVLLVIYPAWDAAANVMDARRNGGLQRNRTQALNAVVSGVTTVAVGVALTSGMRDVLLVFGIWAALAGALQFATAVRRWKHHRAQWAMILSGAQSVLAGAFFIKQAGGTNVNGIVEIAPYAALGAVYFLISAVSLSVSDLRRKRPATVAKA